jgi:hypothetical protein
MERYERPERYERYERPERSERSERSEQRYERAERSTGSRMRDREREEAAPARVPRRVVRNWERLVGAAVKADLEAGDHSDWSSDEDDEDGLDPRMARRPSERYGRTKSYVVPQSLAAQTDIDAVMEAAEDIQKDNVEVARICTCLNSHPLLPSPSFVRVSVACRYGNICNRRVE